MNIFSDILIEMGPFVHCAKVKGHLFVCVELHSLAYDGMLVDIYLHVPDGDSALCLTFGLDGRYSACPSISYLFVFKVLTGL